MNQDNREELLDGIEADIYRLLNAREDTGKRVSRSLVAEVLLDISKDVGQYTQKQNDIARIDELKKFSEEHFDRGLWYYRQKVDDRISELNKRVKGDS